MRLLKKYLKVSFITINKNRFYNNLDYITSLVGDKSKLCLGLKDNAYGHGLLEIASLAKAYGIRHVFVKNDKEAELVKKDFDSVIVTLGRGEEINPKISYTVNSLEDVYLYKKGSFIELKVDTGLHRNGISCKDLKEVLSVIKRKELVIKGVYTHFRSADEDDYFIYEQESLFRDFINTISEEVNYAFRIHCANSHGIFKVLNTRYDLARVGIIAYGYNDIYPEKVNPILSLFAEKRSTRKLNKGDTVGYGSKGFVVKEDNYIISNYDIGYGDGFLRLDEKKKYSIDNGKEILGRVSMDTLSVEGSEQKILLFNDVRRLADRHNTIVYEVLTSLMPTIERRIVE